MQSRLPRSQAWPNKAVDIKAYLSLMHHEISQNQLGEFQHDIIALGHAKVKTGQLKDKVKGWVCSSYFNAFSVCINITLVL